MKTNFQITIEQQVETAAIQTVQGKTPWFVVTKTDELYGPFAGRAVARASGVKGTAIAISGLILEVSGIVAEPVADEVAEIAKMIEAEISEIDAAEVASEPATLVADAVAEVAPTLLLAAPASPLLLAAPVVAAPVVAAPVVAEPAPEVKVVKEISHKSAVKSPCRLVWDLADAMKGARRKDVIAAAQEQGVAFYTARTQYQLWASVQKEMKAREEQNGNS